MNSDILILFEDLKTVNYSTSIFTSTHLTHSQGGTPQISQNIMKLERIEIFQFCLKFENCELFHMHTYPHPHPPTSPTPKGDPPNQLKHNKTYMNQDISILFEDLKTVNYSTPTPTSTHPTHPKGDHPNQLKHNKTYINQDISILFEDLKTELFHTRTHIYPPDPSHPPGLFFVFNFAKLE